MTQKTEKRALGRGLSALLGDVGATDVVSVDAPASPPNIVPIDKIRANPAQPRQTFRDEDLRELASSLGEHGLIQPIVVRPDPDHPGSYQVVAGERRWRAAQIAGLHDLPVIVRRLDDRQVLELAIIENVQRVDLDPIEEAQGYTQLTERFGYTQEELAKVVGKSRSHLANTMRLLSLPDKVLDFIRAGKLTAGHARALITARDPAALAEQAVLKGMTVRQIEAMARQVADAPQTRKPRRRDEKDADTRALEGDLSAALGMRVQIEHLTDEGGGELRIRYKDLDGLDRLCQKLTE